MVDGKLQNAQPLHVIPSSQPCHAFLTTCILFKGSSEVCSLIATGGLCM